MPSTRHRLSGASWECVPVCLDDHSRLAFSQIQPDETAAIDYCRRLGIRVRRVLSDNGGCYRSNAFNAHCAQRGLHHRYTRPFTPRTNCKAERFIQTALREWAYALTYNTSNQCAQYLTPWLHRYKTTQGDSDHAIWRYLHATRAEPELVDAHFELAAEQATRRNYQGAKRHLKSALNFNPNHHAAH